MGSQSKRLRRRMAARDKTQVVKQVVVPATLNLKPKFNDEAYPFGMWLRQYVLADINQRTREGREAIDAISEAFPLEAEPGHVGRLRAPHYDALVAATPTTTPARIDQGQWGYMLSRGMTRFQAAVFDAEDAPVEAVEKPANGAEETAQ
jgi:hypothetical protein